MPLVFNKDKAFLAQIDLVWRVQSGDFSELDRQFAVPFLCLTNWSRETKNFPEAHDWKLTPMAHKILCCIPNCTNYEMIADFSSLVHSLERCIFLEKRYDTAIASPAGGGSRKTSAHLQSWVRLVTYSKNRLTEACIQQLSIVLSSKAVLEAVQLK